MKLKKCPSVLRKSRYTLWIFFRKTEHVLVLSDNDYKLRIFVDIRGRETRKKANLSHKPHTKHDPFSAIHR